MTAGQWAPDHVRRQVMRQARYALNLAVLAHDSVPPEGPFDVALTNGLLAIVANNHPDAVISKGGRTLSARELMPVAVSFGLQLDQDTLLEGLDLTQPLRHGRADDEWIRLSRRHVEALGELDEFEGLQVLHYTDAHQTVDDMVVQLFYDKAQAYAVRDVRRTKDLLDVIDPEDCDECGRRTFIPLCLDDSGGTMSPGSCIACGYQRDQDTAYGMYLSEQWELHWQYD